MDFISGVLVGVGVTLLFMHFVIGKVEATVAKDAALFNMGSDNTDITA